MTRTLASRGLKRKGSDSFQQNRKSLRDSGMSVSRMASQNQISRMHPETLDARRKLYSYTGINDRRMLSQAQLLGRNPVELDKSREKLLGLCAAPGKIASQPQILGFSPAEIGKRYQERISLIRNHNADRSGRRELLTNLQLLGTAMSTYEANVQFLYDLGVSSDTVLKYSSLLGTKPATKRRNMAWMMRELFDYREEETDKAKAVAATRAFVRDRPYLLGRSLNYLEKNKDALRKSVQTYKD